MTDSTLTRDTKIGVIGLGYVGLPLAVELGKRYPTIGYDIDENRIAELVAGVDRSLEVEPNELAEAIRLRFTTVPDDLKDCTIYIVTVPTPVDQVNRPDFVPLLKASETVGRVLKVGDVVIYESTVYPGATEEICVPQLEKVSGLKFNVDFFCGYSPERINPGDKLHRLTNTIKVTSGSTPEVAKKVDALYASIIEAGTYLAPSIRVAEAAKVIENTQRDINIALVNELAILFNRLGIDTHEVLQAARTKWNFLSFSPGLVGGHCIGVDPYYLTHKAQAVGYHPEMILAGRRINDGMASYVAGQVIKLMLRRQINPVGAKVLVLGLAFKENCPDLRNSKVIDLIATLSDHNISVAVHDPWVDPVKAYQEYGLNLIAEPERATYDAVVLAVAHRQYAEWGAAKMRELLKPEGIIYDVKSVLPRHAVDGRL